MENIENTNIDNLYRAGLAHYAEALFSARHFELLIDQAITEAFDEEHKNRLIAALGADLTGGGLFSWCPNAQEQSQNTPQQYWWMWVIHRHWLNQPRINLLIGYFYEEKTSYAVVAISSWRNAKVRDQLRSALQGFADWNDYEIIIRSEPLGLDGTQNDFITALQITLDKFIEFLERKNQQTPNWITTLG